MNTLSWGRRYLMCPPEHFEVLYEINPWMSRKVPVDRDAARSQWERLVRMLKDAGASVEEIAAVEGLPDMVFTANGGIVCGEHFVPGRFLHPERHPETEHFSRWFSDQGFKVAGIEGGHLEGAGDVLPFGDAFIGGYRIRSDYAAHSALSSFLGKEVLSIELVDPRFYHIDLAFCPLNDRSAMVYPGAWDRYGMEVIAGAVPSPVVLEPEEAEAFCANSVVVGNRIVMPACTPRLGRELESMGFEVEVASVGEFLKAGGGVRCLTLALDVGVNGL